MAELGQGRPDHQVILPEAHLSSPIVRHKLLYLWRLTGLPLPQVAELDPLLLSRPWSRIAQSASPEVARMKDLGVRVHTTIAHDGNMSPIMHPATLPWLVRLRIPIAIERFRMVEKKIQGLLSSRRDNFNRLIEQVNTDLFGTLPDHDLCPSPEFQELLSGTGFWFRSDYSESKFSWLHLKQIQRHLILSARTRSTQVLYVCVRSSVGHVHVTPDLVVVTDLASQSFTALTQEMVLMYSDMLEGRDMVLATARLTRGLMPLYEKISSLLDLIDQLASTLHDNVYEVIGILEGLAYAAVQLHEPSGKFAGDFFEFNLKEISSVLKDRLDAPLVKRVLDAVTWIYSGLTDNQSAEMLCILRLWGHPTLESRAAATAVRKQMCAAKVVDFDMIQQVLAFFKGTLINGYRRQNSGVWPRVKRHTVYGPTLEQLHADSAEISHELMLKEYRRLAAIEFEKCIDVDPVSNLSMFLKDKAIAHTKPNWLASFKANLLSDCQRATSKDVASTNRLLIEFMESSDFDPYLEMTYLSSLEFLRDEGVAVSYSLKEKEVKPNGRIFAKLTKKLRNCQVIAENILADEIAPFFQGNGVIQSSISLTKSMLAMSQLSFNCNRFSLSNKQEGIREDRNRHRERKRRRRVATFVTTDLKKYCLNWRYQTVKLFAHAINQLTGLDLFFEWIHLRLMDTTMFVGDPYNPPANPELTDLDEAPNDDIFIVSGRGGIEGLCQKLWTIISISAIQLAATRSKCRVACMVQGDNQVIAVTREVHPEDTEEAVLAELHRASDAFFSELKHVNHLIGHELKDRETIRSDTSFVYSKRIFKDGRILSQILKNASKLVLISGEIGENTPMSCSNLSSTISRLCENGMPKDACYLLNYIMTCTQVLFDNSFSIIPSNSQSEISTWLDNPAFLHAYALWPAQLGGLNNLQYTRLYTRNIGDPCTAALAEIKRLERAGLLPGKLMQNLLARKPSDGTWASLCNDPYALNLDSAPSPNLVLKRHTQKVLFESCTNPLLTGVYNEANDSEEAELAEFLLNQETIHPRVAHAILEASAVGRRKQIQGLLDTTNTIIKIALARKPLSLRKLRKVTNYSNTHLAYFFDDLYTPVPVGTKMVSSNLCSVALADYLRQMSWLPLARGRRILGVSNPDSLELVAGSLLNVHGRCHQCDAGDDQFTWLHLPADILLAGDTGSNPPMRIPYVGSKTQERRTASMAKISNMTPHMKAALRLASVLIWAYGDNDRNWSVAHALANTRCAISLEHLRLLAPLPTAGNLQHRLDDSVTQMTFTPASLYRVAPYIHISNDSQRIFTDEGVKESNIIYQQLMLLGLSAIESLFPLTANKVFEEVTLHLHTKFSCCIREAPVSIPFEMQGEIPRIRNGEGNKFVYDSCPLPSPEATILDIKTFKNYELDLDHYTTGELMQVLELACGKLIGQSVVSYNEDTSIKNDAIIVYDNTRNWISEAQNCDVVRLFEVAALEILLDCAFQMYYLRVKGYSNIVMYMADLFRNMPGILLSNIAATISHPVIHNRLCNAGILSHGSAHQLANVDFIELSANLLSACTSRVLTSLINGEQLSLAFPSVLEDNLTDKMFLLIARYTSLLTLLFSARVPIPNIKGLSAEEKCRALTQHLLNMPGESRLSPRQELIVLQPQLVTFPTNLYYISRKSLNIVREREDREGILELIFPAYDDITESTKAQWDVAADDPFLKGSSLVNHEIRLDGPARYGLLFADCRQEGSRGSLIVADQVPMTRYLFRGIGLASSSWYKATNLLSLPEVRQARFGGGLYLAEGSGAIMSLLELHIPHEKIYYNTLFYNEYNPPQRHFGPTPTQFLNSVVYRNLQAGIPCKDGYVQEFVTLWRDVAEESDLSSDKSVAFITSEIPRGSVSLLHCDIETTLDPSWAYLEQIATNLTLIGIHTLREGGVFILKSLYSHGFFFNLMLNLLAPCSKSIRIISNGYAVRGDFECYIVATFGPTGGQIFMREVLQTGKALTRQGGSILTYEDECKLNKLFEVQLTHTRGILQQRLPDLLRHLHTNIDMSLIEAGGQPVRPSSSDMLASVQIGDLTRDEVIIQYIDTSLKTVAYLDSSDELADTVFVLTPYNLSARGKCHTVLSTCTKHVFELRLLQVSKTDLHEIEQLLSIIIQGHVALHDLILLRSYLRGSQCPKYLLDSFGKIRLREFFEEMSRFTISRSLQKLYLKTLGNAIKGYLTA
ncbi:RNA-dependent RNA polymerase [avian paramyxovirus 21]|uniref:RNA-directed RNA polymerase L n=1 Tax=avian paramyxovirus 21 TaxID=2849510 RepID=A0AAE9G1Q2_9MONO|nr:RNA-dependent RNA polymerase [Avian orthoavulavirus 21]